MTTVGIGSWALFEFVGVAVLTVHYIREAWRFLTVHVALHVCVVA